MDDLPDAHREQTVKNREFCVERISEARAAA
jgi:hypothetical protein